VLQQARIQTGIDRLLPGRRLTSHHVKAAGALEAWPDLIAAALSIAEGAAGPEMAG
jgi:hypothetical protein